MIVVGDGAHGLATHARLTMYPATLFVQYGTVEGEDFIPNGANEVLPLADEAYPELRALEKDGGWDLEEVYALLDVLTTEQMVMSAEAKCIIRANPAKLSAVSGA